MPLFHRAVLQAAAVALSLCDASPHADEFFDFIVNSGFAQPPTGVMICHVGFNEHTEPLSARILRELAPPESRAHVAFFRWDERERGRVEAFSNDFPDRAHDAGKATDFERFEGLCSVLVLAPNDPRFTVEDLRILGRRTGAFVAYMQVGCSGETAHACRFFQSTWEALVGDAASCGTHFCAAMLPADVLDDIEDPQLANINCSALRGPDTPLSQSSQWQQDWFVYRNFVRGTELDTPASVGRVASRRGVFVDIGAFHPIHLSNTFFFERCLGWRGVCAEPNPNWSPYFHAYRPDCALVRNCAWSGPRSVVMSFQKDPIEAYIQEDSASGAVLIQGDGDAKPKFTAECRTLEDILTSQGLRKPARIDYMSVDAEAAEVEIFRVFPFEDFDIGVISVEVQARNYYQLDVIFSTANYAKVAVLGGDHVYAKLSRGLQLPAGASEWHRRLSEDFHAHVQPLTATLQ